MLPREDECFVFVDATVATYGIPMQLPYIVISSSFGLSFFYYSLTIYVNNNRTKLYNVYVYYIRIYIHICICIHICI